MFIQGIRTKFIILKEDLLGVFLGKSDMTASYIELK